MFLANNGYYWEDFVAGKIDIWSICEGHQLVAVLSVKRATNQVNEARGPLNRNIALRHIHHVALFCRKARFSISTQCEGLLAEYAESPILGPRIVVLDKCIAEYAEWPNAVRIDIVGAEYPGWPMSNRYMILSVSFDSALSCAREILTGRNHQEAMREFGAKRLRKIVQNVALDEVTPTVVQHRLLALAA
jgi:hypothetical protein